MLTHLQCVSEVPLCLGLLYTAPCCRFLAGHVCQKILKVGWHMWALRTKTKRIFFETPCSVLVFTENCSRLTKQQTAMKLSVVASTRSVCSFQRTTTSCSIPKLSTVNSGSYPKSGPNFHVFGSQILRVRIPSRVLQITSRMQIVGRKNRPISSKREESITADE